MQEYYSNEVITAMQIGWLEGSKCSAEPGKKDGTATKKATIIDLGTTFVSQNVVKVGDYVIFRRGVPDQVVDANTFESDHIAIEVDDSGDGDPTAKPQD